MARSTARRAWRRRFSSAAAPSSPSAAAWSRSYAKSRSASSTFRSCPTSSSTRSEGSGIERLRQQVGGMPDVEPGGGQMHGTARVRRRDEEVGTVEASSPDRGDFPVPDVGGELRLERVVGAAGAAAEPVVLGVDRDVRRRQYGANCAGRLLNVPEVARVLD